MTLFKEPRRRNLRDDDSRFCQQDLAPEFGDGKQQAMTQREAALGGEIFLTYCVITVKDVGARFIQTRLSFSNDTANVQKHNNNLLLAGNDQVTPNTLGGLPCASAFLTPPQQILVEHLIG